MSNVFRHFFVACKFNFKTASALSNLTHGSRERRHFSDRNFSQNFLHSVALRSHTENSASSFVDVADNIAHCFVIAKCFKCADRLKYPATIPADATLHLEVTNNPFDTSPVWVDITDKANRLVHVFTNTTAAKGYGLGYRFYITKGTQEIEITQATIRFA